MKNETLEKDKVKQQRENEKKIFEMMIKISWSLFMLERGKIKIKLIEKYNKDIWIGLDWIG